MKYFDWDPEKNAWLQEERGVSFEEVVIALEEGCLLDTLEHPNQKRYPRQKVYVVRVRDYAYAVPFVEEEARLFLKTIIPNRKLTKQYLKNKESI